MKTKILVSILKVIFINILILLGILFMLEISARTYIHFSNPEKHFFRENSFTSPWITSYDDPPPRYNDRGEAYFNYRDSPTKKNKDNKLRIITVGGSTTLNQNARRISGLDYALLLEQELNGKNKGKTFEVLNAGADAYSSAHSLINIQFRLIEFNPDIIILMHNINDRTANYFGAGATDDYGNKYLHPFFINPQLQTSLSLSGFLYQSRLLTWLQVPEMFAEARKINYTNPVEDGLAYFTRNLRSIAAICKQNGIQLLLLTQPNRMLDFAYPDEPVHIRQYNAAIKSVSEQDNVAYLDMYTLMGHEPELFIDPVHYSPEGIKKFSRLLAPQIEQMVFLANR